MFQWYPFLMGFIDFTSPLEVWNYVILCLPWVLFISSCVFLGWPWVFKFLGRALLLTAVTPFGVTVDEVDAFKEPFFP